MQLVYVQFFSVRQCHQKAENIIIIRAFMLFIFFKCWLNSYLGKWFFVGRRRHKGGRGRWGYKGGGGIGGQGGLTGIARYPRLTPARILVLFFSRKKVLFLFTQKQSGLRERVFHALKKGLAIDPAHTRFNFFQAEIGTVLV